jgi:cell division protease FtsH
MIWHRLKLIWSRYWIWILLSTVMLASIVAPIIYMSSMDMVSRKYIVGMNMMSLPWSILQTVIFVTLLYLLYHGGGFARLKKAKIDVSGLKVKFTDVIGLSEAKREAWEVVQLIKDRTKLHAVGGKILRGLLMLGPSGCGKTLIARAIASEAGIPFLSVSGSEFVELYVGVGAARVRQLFSQARTYAKMHGACIVFIDEIEVIGKRRILSDQTGNNSETNSTQNQLLVEMDGLTKSDLNIVVMGATNAGEDAIDSALLRPGRFDRKIYVGKPNLDERKDIFKYYLSQVKYDEKIDVLKLARKAVSKSPAEIENIVKEAALIASRNEKTEISYKEIDSAIERIELGIEHKLNLTDKERKMTAYHEIGHLIVLYLTHPVNDVFKVSIRQRGGILGAVHQIPKEEVYSADKNTLLAHIRVSLSGYAAEKIKYGLTSEGVRCDFNNATLIANEMVWRLGMGPSEFLGDFGAISPGEISESIKQKLNDDVQKILNQELKNSLDLLKKEWELVEVFVREILEKEELDYDFIAKIFSDHKKTSLKIH